MAESADVSQTVVAAANGDHLAWNCLVDRYMPLVAATIRRFRLEAKDAEDVSQTVWLRLVEHLAGIKEPRALPGWLVVTTRHEAVRVLRAQRGRFHTFPVDPIDSHQLEGVNDGWAVDDGLLLSERRAAVREGLAELTEKQRDFLLLLAADPPITYDEISRRTGMPIGSIGPTRSRCLNKLRETVSLRALLQAEELDSAGSRPR